MPDPIHTTEPYEILFRFENGAYKGAHYQSINVSRIGDVVTNTSLNHAVPIKDAVGFSVSDFLGKIIVAQEEALQTAASTLKAMQNFETDAEDLRAELIGVRGQLVAAHTKMAEASKVDPVESEPED